MIKGPARSARTQEELDRKPASSISGTRLRARREDDDPSDESIDHEMAALYQRATRRIDIPEELLAQSRPMPTPTRAVRSVPVDLKAFDEDDDAPEIQVRTSEPRLRDIFDRVTLPAPEPPATVVAVNKNPTPFLTDESNLGPLPLIEVPRRITGSGAIATASVTTRTRKSTFGWVMTVLKTLLLAVMFVAIGALVALLATRGVGGALKALHLG